jgi:hypothetical protein
VQKFPAGTCCHRFFGRCVGLDLRGDTRKFYFASTEKEPRPVLIDLDTALTFLRIADTTRSAETNHRNRRNARAAYDAVIRFLPRVHPNAEQQAAINLKLASLKRHLIEAGERF